MKNRGLDKEEGMGSRIEDWMKRRGWDEEKRLG